MRLQMKWRIHLFVFGGRLIAPEQTQSRCFCMTRKHYTKRINKTKQVAKIPPNYEEGKYQTRSLLGRNEVVLRTGSEDVVLDVSNSGLCPSSGGSSACRLFETPRTVLTIPVLCRTTSLLPRKRLFTNSVTHYKPNCLIISTVQSLKSHLQNKTIHKMLHFPRKLDENFSFPTESARQNGWKWMTDNVHTPHTRTLANSTNYRHAL